MIRRSLVNLIRFGSMAVVLSIVVLGRAQDESESGVPRLPETIVEGDMEFEEPSFGIPQYDSGRLLDSAFAPTVTDDYFAGDAVTGTILAIPPLDFPGSIETVTEQLIQDQAARSSSDLFRNVSGVQSSIGGSANRTDDLLIRGFRVRGNSDDFRKNGFRDSSRIQRDLTNIDRIEFLKGPASVLYGSVGEPGGLVNYLTKQPLSYRYDNAQVRIGFFDQYRVMLDSTGPLATSSPLNYRFNANLEEAGSFRDFVEMERAFVAPVISWQLDDRTRLVWEGEFLYDSRVPDRGIPLYKGNLQAVPIDRFLGEPTDRSWFHDGQTSLVLDRRFSDTGHLRVGWVSNLSDEHRDSTDTRRLGSSGGGGGGGGGGSDSLMQRRYIIQDALDQNHYFIGNLSGETCLAGIQHQLVLGTEIGVTLRDDTTLEGDATSIDIFNPIYGTPQPTPEKERQEAINNQIRSIYAQDLMTITPHWKLLAGFRQDWVDATSLDTKADPQSLADDQAATSPRIGLVWQPWLDVAAIYAVYGESFQPVLGSSFVGDAFQPETGQSYEVGIKISCPDAPVNFVLAAFDTERNNVLVPDPVEPDYDLQLGQVRSKGIEMDLVGRLTPAWQLLANAAYMDAYVSEDTQADVLGNRLPNVPYFSTNLWTRYDLIDQPCRKLGVGGGVIYVGHRQGDTDNSYRLPEYTRWDASLYAQRGALRASLYAENLFDAFYIASSRNTERNMPGAPFNLRGIVQLVY